MRTSGWLGFLAWASVGLLLGFTALAMMSIGILLLPIAIFATIVAFRSLRIWPEIVGLCAGPAAYLLWLALRFWPSASCAPHQNSTAVMSGSSSVIEPGAHLTFTGSMSCTSLNTPALLIAGLVLALATPIAYGLCARGNRRMLDRLE